MASVGGDCAGFGHEIRGQQPVGLCTASGSVAVFNLTLLHNTGAAFSFLATHPGWQRWFFAIIAIGATVGLTIWLTRIKHDEKLLAIALPLIIGGALGNLYDRLVHGYVVDFLSFHVAGWYYPAFNVADIAITLGQSL